MHRAAAVAGIVAVSAIHATARQATFSSKVEVVRVDVLVTDGGKPVSGLQPGDFEIRDDGAGFDPAQFSIPDDSGRGLGLATMRERAEATGGCYRLETRAGAGTTLRVSWPANRRK